MVKLGPISWYDRIKTDPSPDDPELLAFTQELSTKVGSRFWYRQIAWGRFHHAGVDGLISMPVGFREGMLALPPPGVLSAELMLPEHLKGKLSVEEWRVVIGMHLLKLKGQDSGAMNRLVGEVGLIIFGLWVPVLVLSRVFLGPSILHDILSYSVLGLAVLLALFWARIRLRPLEFQFDQQAAARFGKEQVLNALEKRYALQPEGPRSIRDRLSNYWHPSYAERIGKLRN